MVSIKVKKLDAAAQVPRYAHVGEFGDLAADVYASAGVVLARAGEAGSTQAVPTGIAMEFPATHGALVEDRSGLAVRGVTTLAGVIDPGYRGEVRVILLNLGREPYTVHAGDRIAQMIVARYEAVEWVEGELADSARGTGGFGSSGR